MVGRRLLKAVLCFSAPILLSSCGQRVWTKEEIIEIAGEAAPYRGGNTQMTLDLEARVIALEQENAMQKSTVERLGRFADAEFDDTKRNVEIYNHFKDTTNYRIDRIESRLGI